jgi:multiple antibiotic resistance protein
MSFSLFLVLNVIGNLPIYISMLARYEMKRQRLIIYREVLIAFVILILFNFFGEKVLEILKITKPIIGIAGGIILFLIALSMIFPRKQEEKNPTHEPIIVPLATPVLAGPGSITTVMVYSHDTSPLFGLFVIIAAMIPSLLIILAASTIKRYLGERGILACEKFGGLIITLIAVQMIFVGTINLVKENFPI